MNHYSHIIKKHVIAQIENQIMYTWNYTEAAARGVLYPQKHAYDGVFLVKLQT